MREYLCLSSEYILFILFLSLVVLLHGDMDQFERNKVINAFKKQEIPVLVATDVAGNKECSPNWKHSCISNVMHCKCCRFIVKAHVATPSWFTATSLKYSEKNEQIQHFIQKFNIVG